MKKLIGISTACVFILALLVSFVPRHIIGTNQYTITEPYEYPITPDDPEWNELVSNVDMINACKVPYSLVYQMTTDALLETVISHPLINNIFAFSTNTAGVQILSNTYQMGLDELLSRTDLEESLLRKYAPIEVCTSELPKNITAEEILANYGNVIDDLQLMNVIEVIAAQLDLTSNAEGISLLDAIAEKAARKNINSHWYGSHAFTYYDTVAESDNKNTANYLSFGTPTYS